IRLTHEAPRLANFDEPHLDELAQKLLVAAALRDDAYRPALTLATLKRPLPECDGQTEEARIIERVRVAVRIEVALLESLAGHRTLSVRVLERLAGLRVLARRRLRNHRRGEQLLGGLLLPSLLELAHELAQPLLVAEELRE